MERDHKFFENISLLVTHYNRSSSLERLLRAFQNLNVSFGQIVVSDDGSKPGHQHKLSLLKATYGFTLISCKENKGLGHNNNKGQAAVNRPFTLYVQEDFEPKPAFPVQLEKSIKMIQNDDIDIIRFYAYRGYPHLKPYTKDYAEMVFNFYSWGYYKYYQYSDHPHLRKSSFLTKFGKYVEGTSSDDAEYQMCLSFVKNKGRGLFYSDYSGLFDQINTTTEPSTANFRKPWKQKKNKFVQVLRAIYLQFKFIKYSIDYLKFR